MGVCVISYTKSLQPTYFPLHVFFPLFLFLFSLLFKTCHPYFQVAHRERFVQGERNGTKLTELCGFFGVPRPLFPIIGLQVSGPLCTICLFACSATFQNAPHPQPLPMSDERKPCLASKASPRFRSF